MCAAYPQTKEVLKAAVTSPLPPQSMQLQHCLCGEPLQTLLPRRASGRAECMAGEVPGTGSMLLILESLSLEMEAGLNCQEVP